MKVIDTNILLDYPQIIDNEDNVILLDDVLKELDGLKNSINSETAYKARRAAVKISRNLDKVKFVETDSSLKLVDDRILEFCEDTNNTLITNDVYLKLKAISKEIDNEGYSNKNDIESGIITYNYENGYHEYLDEFYKTGTIAAATPVENGYIVFKGDGGNKNNDGVVLYYSNGQYNLIEPHKLKIKSQWHEIRPLNPEQVCLFNSLSNRDITILYAGGRYGTGKSFVLNSFAIQELENGNINKIIYVPNNSYTENSMEIGFLPGDMIDKVVGQIGPLVDLVGIDQVHSYIQQDKLEVVPMNSIRGRSFQDSIILVNESQNLTEDHIKLLIARCGKGTRIMFDGDIKQADSQLFRDKNGLKLLLNLHNSLEFNKIFSSVKLITTERSRTARAAEFLDELCGEV